MDFLTGKPDHIEDYLATVRSGQWFGFSDPINKTYANLIVHDGGTKPTEKEVNDGLAAMQAEWALEHDSYRSKRRAEYDLIGNQLDMLYADMIAGKLDATGTWATHIKTIKDKYPKPS